MYVPQILAKEDMKISVRVQQRRRARSNLGSQNAELFEEVADLLGQKRRTSLNFSVTEQALPVVGEKQTQQPSFACINTPGRAINECTGCHDEVKQNATIDIVDQPGAARTLVLSNLNRGGTGLDCTSASQSTCNKQKVSSARDDLQNRYEGEKAVDSTIDSEKQHRRLQEYDATHFTTQCHPALRTAKEIPKRRHHLKEGGALGSGGLRYDTKTRPSPCERVELSGLSLATGRPQAASGDGFDALHVSQRNGSSSASQESFGRDELIKTLDEAIRMQEWKDDVE